jgi:hypothetical protein
MYEESIEVKEETDKREAIVTAFDKTSESSLASFDQSTIFALNHSGHSQQNQRSIGSEDKDTIIPTG